MLCFKAVVFLGNCEHSIWLRLVHLHWRESEKGKLYCIVLSLAGQSGLLCALAISDYQSQRFEDSHITVQWSSGGSCYKSAAQVIFCNWLNAASNSGETGWSEGGQKKWASIYEPGILHNVEHGQYLSSTSNGNKVWYVEWSDGILTTTLLLFLYWVIHSV